MSAETRNRKKSGREMCYGMGFSRTSSVVSCLVVRAKIRALENQLGDSVAGMYNSTRLDVPTVLPAPLQRLTYTPTNP